MLASFCLGIVSVKDRTLGFTVGRSSAVSELPSTFPCTVCSSLILSSELNMVDVVYSYGLGDFACNF